MGKLANKVTLVTGSGRGFGRAIALAFANEGAQVVSVARPSPQDLVELQSLEKTIKNQGGGVLTVPTDLTKEVEIQYLKDKVVERFGRCDVLVRGLPIDEALLTILFEGDEIGKPLQGPKLAVLHAFYKLCDKDTKPCARGTQSKTESSRCLSLTIPCVDLNVSFHRTYSFKTD